MAWFWLALASICEIAWAIGLKHTEGFTRLGATLFTVPTMIASFVFLGLAVRQLPVGTAYAIWTGIGAVGIAIIGMTFYHEPRSAWRIGSIALVVVGIIGLKLSGGSAPATVAQATAESAPTAQ